MAEVGTPSADLSSASAVPETIESAPVAPASSAPDGAASAQSPEAGAVAAAPETPAEPVVEVVAEAQPAGDALAAEPAKDPATAEAKPAEAKPEAPAYAEWTIPENLAVEAPQISAYNNILGKHGVTQEAGQELMDFGASVIKQTEERMAAHQIEVFAETQKGWLKDFEKQAGNRYNTMLADAKKAITDALPNAKDQSEVFDVMNFTGVGNHPAMIKLLAAIGRRSRERPAPGATSLTPKAPASAADRRYGGRT